MPEVRQSTPGDQVGVKPSEEAATGFWDRANLLGDLGGVRSGLAAYGISFGIQETSEVLGNASGGTRRAVVYEGTTQVRLGVDLEKAVGLEGMYDTQQSNALLWSLGLGLAVHLQ